MQERRSHLEKIAVLGTGNIAQTIAVDLKASGHEVRLFAPENLIHRFRDFPDTQVIECVGALEARERIDIITSDIDRAVGQADYIIVCVTGSHHQEYAQMLKGHTSAEQIMVTFNGCMASSSTRMCGGMTQPAPSLWNPPSPLQHKAGRSRQGTDVRAPSRPYRIFPG